MNADPDCAEIDFSNVSPHGLFLHYQPIVSAITGRVVAVEALGRLRGADGYLMSAQALFESGGDASTTRELDRFVMREAIATAQAWRRMGIQIPVHVNVTSSTLVAHQSGKDHDWLHALRIDPTLITVEITEAERITDLPALIGFVRDSRAWGIEVAIDDFGCGNSTLALLQQIEVDVMKIDRRFIASLTGDHRSAAIVRSVIALAHEIGARVVAEGVETDEAWSWLARAECDMIQGYVIARAMPPDAFVSWFETWKN